MYFLRTVRSPSILQGYFSSGIIFTVLTMESPAKPLKVTLLGIMVTKLLMLPITVKCNKGVAGESVLAVILFVKVLPPYPLVLTLIVIFPSPPGGICLV